MDAAAKASSGVRGVARGAVVRMLLTAARALIKSRETYDGARLHAAMEG